MLEKIWHISGLDAWYLWLSISFFFGSSIAHLEPQLESFEVDDIGDDGDDDLS